MSYKNFGFKRKSGIIMPVASLPSIYGIGSFGKPSLKFIDFLSKCGQKCWQVLPLNPTSYGDSPYQSPSSFAGNPYYIDLDILYSKKLLTKEDLKLAVNDTEKIDYGYLFNNRFTLLKKAFTNFKEDGDYVAFIKKHKSWLDDYALFMALKEKNGYKPWYEWEDKDKIYKIAKSQVKRLKKEIDFYKFLQFEFFSQWQVVLNYAKEKGVLIIGDLPIYVAYDSVDVWSNSSEFLLDESLKPTLVAGVPPDAYSKDGQLWGNPIYDIAEMKKNGYKWWINRINHTKNLYDILRIDHFRAFAGYFVVPANDTTAVNGWWEKGVGEEFFDIISKKCKGVRIIAEDLGFITDDVKSLLDYTGFPGMKVLQFAFYDDNSMYLPKNFKSENCVVYTSTHDSETAVEWFTKLDETSLARFKETSENKRLCKVYQLIDIALRSKANLALITIQDYLKLGVGARLNVPSKPEGNWTWRLNKNYFNKKIIEKIYKINYINERV